jgi:succinate dehydrogenase/fumarate reductase flavoprotein subunit
MVDVVVIGGGGAALCAALAAREEGASVLLLSKTSLGFGNCTAYSGGNFTLGVEGIDPEAHAARTRKSGRFINNSELLATLAQNAPAAVVGLQKYGVKMDIGRGWVSVAKYATKKIMAGVAFTLPLVHALKEKDVQVRERVIVTELLVGSERCEGLELFDLATGKMEQVAAGAVVVATGGAGQLFHRTDNPARTTGDGYNLLYQAGAALQDMEFVQFFPLGFADAELPGWYIPLKLVDQAPLRNNLGEEFLRAKFPQWGVESGAQAELFARDRAAVTVAKEWVAGRGAYLHLQEIPVADWEEGTLLADLRRLASGKIDLQRAPVAVAPTQHFFCGGVVINSDGQTEVPGLFACGEVTGGIHGANRVGGNALSELVVFGKRTGHAAALYARRISPRQGKLPAGNTEARLQRWKTSAQGQKPAAIKERLQKLSSKYLGVLRHRQGLETMLHHLEGLVAEMKNIQISKPIEFMEAVELENLLFTGKVVSKAALLREESRGVHYREDFPEEDNDNWLQNIVICPGQAGIPRLERVAVK